MADVQEILKKLEDGVKNVYVSEKYINYLTFLSTFHNYSFRNSLLIQMAKPNSSLVKGFQQWKELDRYVLKGEKAIEILAPQTVNTKQEEYLLNKDGSFKLNEKGEKEYTIKTVPKIIFKKVNVFDISQTDGKDVPLLVEKLKGTSKEVEQLTEICKKISPVNVKFMDIDNKFINGYFDSKNQEIVIQKELEPRHALKTLVHEIAHSMLHDVTKDKSVKELTKSEKELQAESIAYVVNNKFGLDTSDYSFGYVAGWASDKNGQQLKENLEIIQKTSSKIINLIEKEMELLPVKDLSINSAKILVEFSESIHFKSGEIFQLPEMQKKIDEATKAFIEDGRSGSGYDKVKIQLHTLTGVKIARLDICEHNQDLNNFIEKEMNFDIKKYLKENEGLDVEVKGIYRPQNIKRTIISEYKDCFPAIKNISVAGANGLYYLNMDQEKPLMLNDLKSLIKEQKTILKDNPDLVNTYKLEIMENTISELQECKIKEQKAVLENKRLATLEPSLT